MKFSLACVIGASLFFVSSAEAQLCGGAPSFAQTPMQVGVATAFRDGAQGVGGHFAGGGEALFGGAGIRRVNFSPFDATETGVSAFAGADLAVAENQNVFVCPLASVSFASGPDIGGVDVSSVGFEGGGSVGVIASSTNTFMVLPTFGLAAAWRRVTADFRGAEQHQSDTFGIANLGVGFIFNRHVGITPSISIPFSVSDSDVVFTLALAFNFGR